MTPSTTSTTILVILTITAALALAANGSATPPNPPRLSQEQYQAVSSLVKLTQANEVKIRSEILQNQTDLTLAYKGFVLDETRINDLHHQVAIHQSRLLKNYHHLQTELRRIVGPDAFPTLKKRIDAHLKKQSQQQNPD